jgi:hypothetical protein
MWKREKNKADKSEYKEQERKTRNMIKNAKKRFERKLAEGGGNNKKPFYALHMLRPGQKITSQSGRSRMNKVIK